MAILPESAINKSLQHSRNPKGCQKNRCRCENLYTYRFNAFHIDEIEEFCEQF
jgi:hypothetical protein